MVTGLVASMAICFLIETLRCHELRLHGAGGHAGHRITAKIACLRSPKSQLPILLIAEGGGGRPGDTVRALLTRLSRLSTLRRDERPRAAHRQTGRRFAGNAVLLGCSDIVIATKDSNIGIGGPAMIEGGGLGIFTPDEGAHVRAGSERCRRYCGRG